jgi:hypothetical protein
MNPRPRNRGCCEIAEWQLRGTFAGAPTPWVTPFRQFTDSIAGCRTGEEGGHSIHQGRDVDALGRPDFFAPNGLRLV